MSEVIYREISDLLRLDMHEDALSLLKEHPQLDTTFGNGEFIHRAISAKNAKLTDYLISHYHGLRAQRDTMEYRIALHKMQTIIKECVETCDIPYYIDIIISRFLKNDIENNTITDTDSDKSNDSN